MPVYKDLGAEGMLYGRSYSGRQMPVGEGVAGETLTSPINEQGDISMDTMDTMVHIGAQVADRFPVFDTAGVASSWTGVCDVTPDWNPVLGRLPEEALPLPVTPVQEAPWRSAREAWYEIGAQAAHLAADRL